MKKVKMLSVIVLALVLITGCSCSTKNNNTASITTTGIDTGVSIDGKPICLGHKLSEYEKDYPGGEFVLHNGDNSEVKSLDEIAVESTDIAYYVRYNNAKVLWLNGNAEQNQLYGDIITKEMGISFAQLNDVEITIGNTKLSSSSKVSDITDALEKAGAQYNNSFDGYLGSEVKSYNYNGLNYTIMGNDSFSSTTILTISAI